MVNNWTLHAEDLSKVIFPKGSDGKSIRVALPKYSLQLKHTQIDDVCVTFTRYKTQGKWFYRDSRSKVPITRSRVVSEVARMLQIPTADADTLVAQYLI